MNSETLTRPVVEASRFIKAGKWLVGEDIGSVTEAPRQLRQACAYGAGGVLLISLVGMLNIFSLLSDPPAYFLKAYLALFAIWTIVLEVGIQNEGMRSLREVLLERCRFFESLAGRGAFYTFTGVLGTSLWSSSPLDAVGGLFMSTVGFLCVATSRSRDVASNGERSSTGGDALQEADNMNYFRQDITAV